MRNLDENSIDNTIRQLRHDVDGLKGTQFIGGDSLQFYQSDTGNAYDWSGTLPANPAPGVGVKILLVEAVAQVQPVLFADIIFELYVGSLSNRYTPRDYLAAVEAASTGFQIYKVPYPLLVADKNKARWGIGISGDLVTTCYAKFYVVANDSVAITVTAIN